MKQLDLIKIYRHFRPQGQIRKLQEECTELADAIHISMTAYMGDAHKAMQTPAVITEMADVTVMLAQFKFCEPELWEQIEEEAECKIQRTLERMETGYYEDKP